MQDIEWDDLRILLAIARTQRAAAAARRLGINETTVARRLARIEQRLDARLFERIDGRLRPTEMGSQVLIQAEQMERAAQQVEAIASGADSQAVGLVRLTAVPLLIKHLLLPRLPELIGRHPGLEIHLIAEPRNLSLGDREADIVLRFGCPAQETRAITRRVCDLEYAVYGPIDAPWVLYEPTMGHLPHAQWLNQAQRDAKLPPLIVNDSDVAFEAVASGLGRSLVPIRIARNHPSLGGEAVRPILSRDLWIATNPDQIGLARVRAVMDWVRMVCHDD